MGSDYFRVFNMATGAVLANSEEKALPARGVKM